MVILEKPYVSDFLAGTLERLGVPVLRNEVSEALAGRYDLELLDGEGFAGRVRGEEYPGIYTSSEDALGWIAENLSSTGLPERVRLLKDKLSFRRMMEGDYPDFHYEGIDLEALRGLDPERLPSPFIVKPAVGFFSMAVRRVESPALWPAVLQSIEEDLDRVCGMYPKQVFDPGMFIIEEDIRGEEYAVDAYYDGDGSPVVLNVLRHVFSSHDDVGDTTYITSKEIVEFGIGTFTGPLERIGRRADLRNFPLHIEMRVDGDAVVPIEANPLRFAGFGATDFGWFAWGINTHEYFLRRKRPDWKTAFAGKVDRLYSMYVAFIPGDLDVSRVEGIDYDGFAANFSKIFEMRRTDWRTYRVFAFVFSETGPETKGEIERNLGLDLSRYVKVGK